MLDSYDALLKWAVLSSILAGLSVLAACAESAPFAFPGLTEQGNPAQVVERRVRTGPAPDQQALLGKIGPEVTTLLGEPSLLRQEMGAQVWQYAGVSCVLLLYLYQDDDKAYRVTHVEARPRRGGVSDVDACLEDTYRMG